MTLIIGCRRIRKGKKDIPLPLPVSVAVLYNFLLLLCYTLQSGLGNWDGMGHNSDLISMVESQLLSETRNQRIILLLEFKFLLV